MMNLFYDCSNFETTYNKISDFKPIDFKPIDFQHIDFKLIAFELNDFQRIDFKLIDFKLIDFKLIDFKLIDFKLIDFKLPDHSDTLRLLDNLISSILGHIFYCDSNLGQTKIKVTREILRSKI